MEFDIEVKVVVWMCICLGLAWACFFRFVESLFSSLIDGWVFAVGPCWLGSLLFEGAAILIY